MNERDDITDNSVVLAGPGNIKGKSSNSTSILEVPVGCDGRIFPQYTNLIHQLKQQAKDGTISEVIRLPVIGWRVKVYRDKADRARRQALEPSSDIGKWNCSIRWFVTAYHILCFDITGGLAFSIHYICIYNTWYMLTNTQ